MVNMEEPSKRVCTLHYGSDWACEPAARLDHLNDYVGKVDLISD